MKMEPKITQRIVKNVLLSLFIYALPIALMLLAFYFSGERPWKQTRSTVETHASEKK
jgi:hypothetical protein